MNETENTTTEVPELNNVAVAGLLVGVTAIAGGALGWLAGAGIAKLAEKVMVPRIMKSQIPEI